MMMVKSELRMSPIDGLGVYAVEPIKSGTVVWKLDERAYVIRHESEIASLPPIMQEHFAKYGWPLITRAGFIACDIDNGRFMNHSDRANTDFRNPHQGVAIADIAAGQEITCNYAEFDARFKGFA